MCADRIDAVWQEYRRPSDPAEFAEAVDRIDTLAGTNADRLSIQEFCRDATAGCPDCAATPAFRPAERSRVFAILGYV